MSSQYHLPGIYAFERPVIGNYGSMSRGKPKTVQHVNMVGSKYQGPVNPVVEDVWPKVHKESGKVALTADIRQCEWPGCEVFVQGRDYCLHHDQIAEEQRRGASQGYPGADGQPPANQPMNIISPPTNVPAGAGILHSVSAVPVEQGAPAPPGAFQAPPQFAYPAPTMPAAGPPAGLPVSFP